MPLHCIVTEFHFWSIRNRCWMSDITVFGGATLCSSNHTSQGKQTVEKFGIQNYCDAAIKQKHCVPRRVEEEE